MKKIIVVLIIFLAMTSCDFKWKNNRYQQIVDTNSGIYYLDGESIYKVTDQTMFKVSDITNPFFHDGNVLSDETTIPDKMIVKTRVKQLTSSVFYIMSLSAISGELESIDQYVSRSNSNSNDIEICLRNSQGFTLSVITVPLNDLKVKSWGDDKPVSYTYEGSREINPEVNQEVSLVEIRWSIAD